MCENVESKLMYIIVGEMLTMPAWELAQVTLTTHIC